EGGGGPSSSARREGGIHPPLPDAEQVHVEIEAEAPPEREANAPEGPASEVDTSPTDVVASLNAEIEKLKTEKKETYDRLLRTAADFENFKKRKQKEDKE